MLPNPPECLSATNNTFIFFKHFVCWSYMRVVLGRISSARGPFLIHLANICHAIYAFYPSTAYVDFLPDLSRSLFFPVFGSLLFICSVVCDYSSANFFVDVHYVKHYQS